MIDWLRKLLTGVDNNTPSPARHGWLLGNIGVIAAACVAAFKGVAVDLVQLATALGIVNGASGAAAKLEESSQPKGDGQ
jgi:hypothetical protein